MTDVEITQRHIDLVNGVVNTFVRRKGLFMVDRDALRGAALESLARSAQRYDGTITCQTFEQFAAGRMWFAMIDELRALSPGSRTRRHLAPMLSLDVPVASDEGDRAWVDTIRSEEDTAEVVVARAMFVDMMDAIDGLPARERDVLLRAMSGEKQEHAAAHYGVTVARISQIGSAARTRLKRAVAA